MPLSGPCKYNLIIILVHRRYRSFRLFIHEAGYTRTSFLRSLSQEQWMLCNSSEPVFSLVIPTYIFILYFPFLEFPPPLPSTPCPSPIPITECNEKYQDRPHVLHKRKLNWIMYIIYVSLVDLRPTFPPSPLQYHCYIKRIYRSFYTSKSNTKIETCIWNGIFRYWIQSRVYFLRRTKATSKSSPKIHKWSKLRKTLERVILHHLASN